MGLPRKPRPPRRLRLAEQTHLAPPFELSHWGKRSSRRAHRALDGQRNSTEQSGAERPRATDRGEPTSTSVPLRISFRALVRASEGPSPLLSFASSPVEDPHCVEDVRHHRLRGLLQQHEERRRRLQERQQDISDIKNDYHCSSNGRRDGGTEQGTNELLYCSS